MMPRALPLVLLLAPAPLLAQRPDSARADSAQRLVPVRVTVTRTSATLQRVPWAASVLDVRAQRAARPAVGLDDLLALAPGVLVSNRYNFAVDQRVAVRGFGARANFGVRGVTILLDGVPQTLPDGQSQLNNVDLANVSRVEVLRGPASALYGNGAGGAIAFTTDLAAPRPVTPALRVESGAFGLRRATGRVAARGGRAVGVVSGNWLRTDGFRQWSHAEQRQVNGALDWDAGARTVVQLRAAASSLPRARNPGALTFAEWRANADSASASSILRGADKVMAQQQLSLAVRRADARGIEWSATLFGVHRDLDNALATPPPGAPSARVGTFVHVGRAFGGGRLGAALPLGTGPRAARLTLGLDAQRLRDARRNWRATGGRPTAPTDTLLLDQAETVSSLAPSAGLAWAPVERLTLDAGGRLDRVRFAADDRFLRDGRDDSGARDFRAGSWHLGASWQVADALVPYASAATSIETPTTTELQAGGGGFDQTLAPQRARALELGARGRLADGRLTYGVSTFRTDVRDAIVQWLETGGRAYFRNAAGARNVGAELEASARVSRWLAVDAAYTYARYRFTTYRAQRGAAVDTLDGRQLPGVPRHYLRWSARLRPLGPAAAAPLLVVDHTVSAALWADDRNTLRVPGWGRGLLDARLGWRLPVGGAALAPSLGVANLFDQRYVSAVTVNGAAGRVLEPAPGRSLWVGLELGWGP